MSPIINYPLTGGGYIIDIQYIIKSIGFLFFEVINKFRSDGLLFLPKLIKKMSIFAAVIKLNRNETP